MEYYAAAKKDEGDLYVLIQNNLEDIIRWQKPSAEWYSVQPYI